MDIKCKILPSSTCVVTHGRTIYHFKMIGSDVTLEKSAKLENGAIAVYDNNAFYEAKEAARSALKDYRSKVSVPADLPAWSNF